MLSQQLHEQTQSEVENSLDGRETPQNECADTRAYIHLPTTCESRCHAYGPKERQSAAPQRITHLQADLR